jgi:hypothetical protein
VVLFNHARTKKACKEKREALPSVRVLQRWLGTKALSILCLQELLRERLRFSDGNFERR